MESCIDASDNAENRSIKERLDKLAEDIKKLPFNRIEELEKIIHSMDKKVVTLKEAAKLLDVHVDTIRRAVKTGRIQAFQINKAGSWKISIQELDRFIKGSK